MYCRVMGSEACVYDDRGNRTNGTNFITLTSMITVVRHESSFRGGSPLRHCLLIYARSPQQQRLADLWSGGNLVCAERRHHYTGARPRCSLRRRKVLRMNAQP